MSKAAPVIAVFIQTRERETTRTKVLPIPWYRIGDAKASIDTFVQ